MIEPCRLIITTLSFLSGSRRNLDHSPAQRGRHSNGARQDPLLASGRYQRSARRRMRQAKPAMLTKVGIRASMSKSWAATAATARRLSASLGRLGARVIAPIRVAFRHRNDVGTQDEGTFAAQWLAYALPCQRFANTLTGIGA